MIFGTGQGADTARRYFEWDTPREISGYVVDREFFTAGEFKGRPVVAVDEAVGRFPPGEYLASFRSDRGA